MVIQVVPARRMPLSLPVLDYSVPKKDEGKIKIGQLVKIPFRHKEEFGVILEIKSSALADIKIKPIKKIVFSEPILSKKQLNFLTDISEFYHVSLGFLLKTNLLPLQSKKLDKLSYPKQNLIHKIKTPDKPEVFTHKNEEEEKDFILKKIKQKSGQSLILVPELVDIKKITNLLPADTADRTIIITSELSNKELFIVWLQICSGEKDIVIGTRTALFLPWFNLINIILTDEGNSNYKSWDMAPRLHTRDAALFLSKHHGAKLSLLSHTPSVESYYFAKNKVYLTNIQSSSSDQEEIKPINKTAQIIDIKSERRGGNYSLISIEVLEELKKIKTGDIVFFLNRRGTANHVSCGDCGNVLKCPHCKLALTFHQNKNILYCHNCQYFEPMPSNCKNCNGLNLATYGAGTQLAEELIKKITAKINDHRQIIRIDSDKDTLNKIKIKENQPDKDGKIIICTQLAWQQLEWEKVKLFVFLDADTSLFIPEYKIIENLWQQLRDAQYKLPTETPLFIQTKYPEHFVFKSLYDPNLFYSEQLAERRVFGYPPFKYMLKLLIGDEKAVTSEREAVKIYSSIFDLTKNIPGIKITGPLETSPYHHNGQYWQVILVKIGYENYKKSTKMITDILPENCKTDPNPNSLLYFS